MTEDEEYEEFPYGVRVEHLRIGDFMHRKEGRGSVRGYHDDAHSLVHWDDGTESVCWVGHLRKLSLLELIAEAANESPDR